MKLPAQYIAEAVRNVRGVLGTRRLAHGEETAGVSVVTSERRGEDELSGSGDPTEAVRILALARDFPTVTKGDAATLDDDTRIVTSVRTDPAGASMHIGLSRPLDACAATVAGTRGSRQVRFAAPMLVLCNGLSPDITEGFAPTSVYAWTLCAACDEWPDRDGPHIGDEVRFDKDGRRERVRLTKCEVRGRVFVMSARSR